MRTFGYVLGFLASLTVGWLVPVFGVAVLLPLLQVIYTLQPLVAVIVMLLLAAILVWWEFSHQAIWQGITWLVLWLVGAISAALGVFHWYALIVESTLVVLLLVPGLVAPVWANLLRWFAIGEIVLTLMLLGGSWVQLPGTILVLSLLFFLASWLVGYGAYRPYEARKIRRLASRRLAIAGVLLLLWQPLVLPAWKSVPELLSGIVSAVYGSPPGMWYRMKVIQMERRLIAEEAKTGALKSLSTSLTDAHKLRYEKGIERISDIPLTTNEWKDLKVERGP